MTKELKTFGELEAGDMIRGTSGPTTVTQVYKEHTPDSMYRIAFDNGKEIEASGNHLWYIETSLDRQLHKRRVKKFRKLFSPLSEELERELKSILALNTIAETALIDVIELMQSYESKEKINALIRIAESIGPVAEEDSEAQDLLTGDSIRTEGIRLYDAKRFVQQIFALSSKAWEKKWPIMVGKVVTTEYLATLALHVEIPDVEPYVNQTISHSEESV